MKRVSSVPVISKKKKSPRGYIIKNVKVHSTGNRNEEKKVKGERAKGECLGTNQRRRTRKAAISFGESHKGVDPEISEWGNPAEVMLRHRVSGADPGN